MSMPLPMKLRTRLFLSISALITVSLFGLLLGLFSVMQLGRAQEQRMSHHYATIEVSQQLRQLLGDQLVILLRETPDGQALERSQNDFRRVLEQGRANTVDSAEQAALEATDRVVLQFPMYWYSTPALLKQWQDDVLLYGWAYGSTGKALAGKELLVAVSTGGPGDAYSHESSYGYTLTELLRPLQATANMVQMTYLEPFTTTGTLTITDEALAQRVEDYAATLASKDLPVLEPHG